MLPLRKLLSVVLISLLVVMPVGAQQIQLASNNPRGGQPLGLSDSGEGGSGSAAKTTLTPAEARARYVAKQKRREALKRYLSSVGVESSDYAATERAIRKLDDELHALAAYAPHAPASVKPPLAAAATRAAPVAQASPQALTAWLNIQIDEKVKALINQGSNSNQTETPAASGSSTALVDQSSASDLIGVAANLLGLGEDSDDGEDDEGSSVSVTASAYALYAAYKGEDPLRPSFYNAHRRWRQWSFTLGYEKRRRRTASPSRRGRWRGSSG